MVEAGAWEVVKTVSSWIIYLLILPASWLFKKYAARIEKLEEDIAELDKQQAVTNVLINELRNDIKEIKHNVERLVDRR